MNKISKIDVAIVTLIYSMVVILGFFGLQRNINKIIIALILLRIFSDKGRVILKNKYFNFGILILICIIIISLVLNGPYSLIIYGWSNILRIMYSMIYCLYFYYLYKYHEVTIKYIYDHSWLITNIVMIANIFAVNYQMNHPGKLMASSINAYSDGVIQGMISIGDTASGFFAFASVHTLCIFSIFTIIYDCTLIKQTEKGTKKLIQFIFIITITILNIEISLLNDNKAFFLLLPISLIVLFLMGANLTTNYLKRIGVVIIIVILAFVLLKLFNSNILNAVGGVIQHILNFSGRTIRTGEANGSNERIAIPIYALKQLDTWLFGTGISIANIYQAGFRNFNHFGQSDLGTLLIFIGIWFTVLLCCFFIELYHKIVVGRSNEASKTVLFSLIIIFFVMLFFTQIVTNFNNQIVFIFLIMTFERQYKSNHTH